ncbi:hypothetical protein ADINL_0700 [Nitrincola lacisaponensis]|uniref:Uncharacterized protein n=1 Tax=Nitrincola lacisaponensis TaxID=267850 RepID=A0A063Y1B1_9GAMM|nr:glycosyltransferase family 4 protein [Nitrincola lacisaponensis]KDE40108.1 hypothetical protein ADINL_0700 [Nitrincola lacisaponensis]
MALLKDRCALELHIAGSGPDQAVIEALAQQLGVASALHLSGE